MRAAAGAKRNKEREATESGARTHVGDRLGAGGPAEGHRAEHEGGLRRHGGWRLVAAAVRSAGVQTGDCSGPRDGEKSGVDLPLLCAGAEKKSDNLFAPECHARRRIRPAQIWEVTGKRAKQKVSLGAPATGCQYARTPQNTTSLVQVAANATPIAPALDCCARAKCSPKALTCSFRAHWRTGTASFFEAVAWGWAMPPMPPICDATNP